MKQCPRCDLLQTWTLGDGRFKCCTCGTRFTWKSAWDSVRLPEEAKQTLVEAFVQGISVYQQRHQHGACIASRERFYRTMRAVCALDARITCFTCATSCQSVHNGARDCMRGWSGARAVAVVGIDAEGEQVRIALPPPEIAAGILPLLREHSAIGGVYRVQENSGFATLPVCGDHVVVQRNGRAPLAMSVIEVFWNYARGRLQMFRRIRCQFLHLYLGEMSFRFNHNDADLCALLCTLLKSTSSEEVELLLRVAQQRQEATL